MLALSVVHKYDCIGVRHMLGRMNDDLKWRPAAWFLETRAISQTHIDYIVAGQELYGTEFLNGNMKTLLALLLTYKTDRIVRKYCELEELRQMGEGPWTTRLCA